MNNPAAQHQPAPVKSDRDAIQDLVVADLKTPFQLMRVEVEEDVQWVTQDIEDRKRVGLERYGTLLQAFNGRDALMDAYQEALDLMVYSRQVIEERALPYDVARMVYESASDTALILRREIEKRRHAVV